MLLIKVSSAIILTLLGLQLSAYAQSRRETAAIATGVKPEAMKERINAWTVGLAGGLIEGAPLRLAAEIARVVNEEAKLHVLPIVTRGATENVNALLYLKGVDAAIINTDALDEYKAQMPLIERRIVYLLNLFPSELHIFVRPEIRSLEDLQGKKVNFNTQGTAAAYSGPLIFSRLGLSVEKMFIPHQLALEQMKRGELSAVVFVTSKPVDAFVKGRWEPGFKFLAVEYDAKFEDYYLPSSIEATDYPSLMQKDERVATIAVPTILAAFNWSQRSDRYRRVERLVNHLFSRLDQLQAPGFDPKWKQVNLRASVPGLGRFRPAQEWLDRPLGGTAGVSR
ncbi:TAXI family TRAP transporter solute-binding subunit [Bradyrhizobium sp. CB3481]|uniref:TAXI family TRAP transporter solute-binding subunit n=1 Tax=Bradyrhizobium sp. CB3481 TaxID=3039158 RepID=UPI0024B15248|nr:TAXI family TRAP transporter solute-binding subunit [Bradyrhizobium sp. CB3481]WFU18476.1 TAXI family TRAP transporter solute-binding subunit [Bradyrhizobium sp. CB3481]